jgi:hypothetical protein
VNGSRPDSLSVKVGGEGEEEKKTNNNNNSILYYLRAESTATRPITGTAQCG